MDEPDALWIPSANYFPLREGHTPRYVIIHGTAGFESAEAVGYFFQQADVATHYIIDRDGTLVQCVRECDGAWGNGGISTGHAPWWDHHINPNNITISIEHVKPSRDNSDELTDAQKVMSFQLVQRICARHTIPLQPADAHGGITGHFSMDPIHRHFCPGPYPWHELFAFLTHTNTTIS